MKIKKIKELLLLALLLTAAFLISVSCSDTTDDLRSLLQDMSSYLETIEKSEDLSEEGSTELNEENTQSSFNAGEVNNSTFKEDINSEENDVNTEDSSTFEEDSSLENSSSPENSSSAEDNSGEQEDSSVEDSSNLLPHIHSYASKVIRQSDCELEGVMLYSCECGDDYSEAIKALGHESVVDSAVAATCIKIGLTEGSHCARCEEIFTEQETTDMIPHSYKDGYCVSCNLVGLEFTVNEEEGYAICTGYTGETVRRVVIPDEYYGYPVKELAAGLFEGCNDLYAIEIGANVEVIGEGAFHQCYHLVEIYDRSKAQVTKYNKLDNGALTSYAEDDDIHYEPFESEIEIIDDFVIFNDDGERVLLTYLGHNKKIVIPEGVTVIQQFALAWEYEVLEVTIASTVKSIEKYAFYLDLDMEMIHFLDPEGWEARKESTSNWVRFADGHLVGGENGRNALIDLYVAWEWRKVE